MVQCFFAEALPPLRPAALCWAVVPPWSLLPDPECDVSPPCSEAFGEFAILAARSLDIPLSFRASYCFSFFTLADLLGMASLLLFDAAGVVTQLWRSPPRPTAMAGA